MPVPKKRNTRSAQGQRRSHDALKAPELVKGPKGELIPRRLWKAVTLGLLKKSAK